MNQLTKVFDEQELTIVENDGEPTFLLKDVCNILELGQVAGVKRRLDKDVISNHPLQTAGGIQQATFVNEDGLYDVILDSRKLEAKRFRKWITSEVIPTIRKTGSYQHPQTQLEILQGAINQMVAQDQRLTAVERKQDNINELLSLNPTEWRKKVNNIINKIAQSRGGFQAYRDVRNESYKILEERGRCQLSTRLTNRKQKMALEGSPKSKVDKTSKMDVIADDARLTEIYLAVVKEMAIKNDVEMAV